MLEKITTSAPFCCTLSTSDTYRFLVFGSLALQSPLYLDCLVKRKRVRTGTVHQRSGVYRPPLGPQLDKHALARTMRAFHLIPAF